MNLDPRRFVRLVALYAAACYLGADLLWRKTLQRSGLKSVCLGLKTWVSKHSTSATADLLISRVSPMVFALLVVSVALAQGAIGPLPIGLGQEPVAAAQGISDSGLATATVTADANASTPIALAAASAPGATAPSSSQAADPTATATNSPQPTAPAVAATPDTRQEAASRSPERAAVPTPTNANALQTQFILAGVGPAQTSQQQTGVPASVTLAQAALESDWGRSGLSTKAKNFFGIKASAGPGPAGVINMNTGEVINGASVTVNAAFKAYNTMEESFADHGVFLKSRSRYAACFQTKDPKEFARRLLQAGYATDPAYATKLITFMDKFNLYAYDLP